METALALFIVVMHPAQDRLFLPFDRRRPFAGTRFGRDADHDTTLETVHDCAHVRLR